MSDSQLIERVDSLERAVKELRPDLHYPSTATLEQRVRWLERVVEELRNGSPAKGELLDEEALKKLLGHTTYIKPDRITLHSLTADPATIGAGDTWYRSDLGKPKFAVDTATSVGLARDDHTHTVVKDASSTGYKPPGPESDLPAAYYTLALQDGVTTLIKELSITTVANARLYITAYMCKSAGDESYNYMKLYLDGAEKASTNVWDLTDSSVGYGATLQYDESVSAGTHNFSARMRNTHFSRDRKVLDCYLVGVSCKV